MRQLTFCVFALCCSPMVSGQIDLSVVQSKSELEITLNNSTDVSSILGSGSLVLAPVAKPFSTAQLSELNLDLADGFQVAVIPGLLFIEADPGEASINFLTPGMPGAINGQNQFDQLGNLVQFSGVIEVVDPLNLFGGNMELDLSLTPPVNLDLTDVQLSIVDSEINVSTAFEIEIETPAATLAANGNILLNGKLEQFIPGDVNLDGEVNFLDVQPFVDLIISNGFQLEADINQDGSVDLLDVAPMSDLISIGSN